MRAVDLIRKKRDGHALNAVEIAWLVEAISREEIEPYQWSAMLMAILWRGMDAEETRSLTYAMMHSGVVVDLASIPGRKIDKHSTGGVGDKTSLILAPIAAACGVIVPMVSGRGLGHTGGTLDKLESIPGFRVDLSLDDYQRVARDCGMVLAGQTSEIAPADRYLYALRDATGTVESIPLIAASIMSKKLAEGIDGLVLDVKTGSGAFMERLDDARRLAETMVSIGRGLRKRMVALITRMDQPLGQAVGNAIEVAECIACLRGDGPSDLTNLSVELAAEMVLLGERADSIEEARSLCRRAIADGSAVEMFRRVIEAQGGDSSVIDTPSRLPVAKMQLDVLAPRAGYLQAVRARPIGHATMLLGAGRSRVGGTINPAVGIVLHRKRGEFVAAGEPLCTILADDENRARDLALPILSGAYTIGDDPVQIPELIVERL